MPSFDELKTEIQRDSKYKTLNQAGWEAKIKERRVDVKFDADLEWLQNLYANKISRIRESLQGDWSCFIALYGPGGTLKTAQELGEELIAQVSASLKKEERLLDKLACVIKEKELRKAGLVTRNPHHTTYYADYANGTDGASGTVHDGLKEDNGGSNYTGVLGTTNTTAFVAQGAFDNDTDDDYNGDYFYNVTRGAGATINDYDANDGSGNSVLYHDSIVGQTDGDEFYIIRAWKTIHKYTSVTVRTPGDILKLRANTTWNYGAGGENQNINFDENGTDDDYITIKGCDSSDDPWDDDSDVKPQVNFDGSENTCDSNQDHYWKWDNVTIQEASVYNFHFQYTQGIYFKDCVIQEGLDTGLRAYQSEVFLENCTIKGNQICNIRMSRSRVHLKTCILDSGSSSSDYGVWMLGGILLAEDTTFGVIECHDLADIYLYDGAPVILLRNCLLDSDPRFKFVIPGYYVIHEEDSDQVFEVHKSTYLAGTVERNTVVTRTGGANSSALIKPSLQCGSNYPLTLRGQFDTAGDFKIWCPAAETTVTIYMRRYENWTAEPTSSELYIQASYLNNGASASRALSTKSSQSLPDSDVWTAFTTTFTPAREGWAYVTVSLEKYESGKGVYVDIKPVVS